MMAEWRLEGIGEERLGSISIGMGWGRSVMVAGGAVVVVSWRGVAEGGEGCGRGRGGGWEEESKKW